MRIKQFILFCISYSCAFVLHAASIALIIDDMGNSRVDEAAFDLPAAITFAILPHTPFSEEFAARSAAQDREVMLHMPMESLAGNNPGPGTITSTMQPELITQKLQYALANIPNAIGINNHMGSKLTQLTLPMTTTMAFLRKHGLFFVDSRTTRYSKAEKIAQKQGVMAWHRNVFIDHTLNTEQMNIQLQRLVRIARKYRQAVGIAHPHPATLKFLQQHLPQLREAGIELIPVSQVFEYRADSLLLARQQDGEKESPEPVQLAPDGQ
ncbi:divergent polysaccharide deacetylase family protein [Neptunicella sp. SCSIO 80796]|uniref:divergent polysaccharide deacetylase family protein n=1 Tax=Neptunicella plasticusilytica TaxID=3117012 RepID=UPI003A4D31CA